jgi:uncharacterized protein YqhQ
VTHHDDLHAFTGNGAGPEQPPAKVRLGGMALRNGLLVHGPDHWAVALRAKDGGLRIESGAKPRLRGPIADLPGIRGIARLGEAFALLPVIKRQVPEVQLPFEDVKVLGAMVGSSVLTAGARRLGRRSAGNELMVAALGMVPTAFALRDSQLAAYHGVEHKAIAGYEQDTDAALVAKEHDRCGSNLVAPMILSTVVGNLLVRSVLGLRGPVASTAVTLAGVAISVEMFAWSERNHDTALAHAFRKPGYEMQRLFATREPTTEQLEVGRAALIEILRREAP